MDFIYRPLTVWPGPMTRNRERSRFRAKYANTLDLLDRELAHLKARQIVLQVALREEDIRLDGKPRANARPTHPGIILSFESKHGPLSYPCDRFDNWEDNLRAIALSLEHLRAVDRYGVTKRGEQYAGWKALPDKSNGFIDIQSAVAFLVQMSAESAPDKITQDNYLDLYRKAARATHPDMGGDPEAFKRVQAAKEVLKRHFGG